MTRKPKTKAAPAARGARSAASPKTNEADLPASAWASGVVFAPKESKMAVSLRLDADLLRFFRALGRGYQTRINEVLRVFMEVHQSAKPAAPARKAERRTRR